MILDLRMYTLFSRCVGSFRSAKEAIDHRTPGRILIAEEVRRHMEPLYSLYSQSSSSELPPFIPIQSEINMLWICFRLLESLVVYVAPAFRS